MNKKNIWDWTKTIGSAAVSAAVLYHFIPIQIGACLLTIVIAHEFGHFVTAWFLGEKADPPIFIPLGILILGLTRVRSHDPEVGQFVALGGPIFGALVALVLLVSGILTGNIEVILVTLWFLCWELFNMSFGSDGKKFRKFRRDFNQERGQAFT